MKKKIILILLILTLSIYALNINVQISAEENDYRLTSLELTPHNPIYMTSDIGFEVFPGSGTDEDPYVIEGYNITTTDSIGIYITDTTKYFIVRNCYVDAEEFGIYINSVADETVTIINNTCSNNSDKGIKVWYSGSSTVADNTCIDNNWGIYIAGCVNSTVANNTCTNNYWVGIVLYFSGSSTVTNNTCSNNSWGIELTGCGSSTVTNNTCNNNDFYGIEIWDSDRSTVANNTCNTNRDIGIWFRSSGRATVANNTCNDNDDFGIDIWDSDSCVLSYNLLHENGRYGIYLNSYSNDSIIHHNTFVDNNLGGTLQALDNGNDNTWYDTETLEGNYWSDWLGIGSYSIDGSADSIDLYPLDEPTVFLGPPNITGIIHSPATPTELDIISINATVISPYSVQSVTLHYRVNSGTWIEASMTLISGELYSVTIGPFAVGDTTEYYISATDDSVNHNEATNDNSGLYYSFTVSEVIPEFQTLSLLLPMITSLFLIFSLIVQQRRKT